MKPQIIVNPKRTFCPGVTYKKLGKMDFDKAVLAFKKRIQKWYLTQGFRGIKGHDGFLRTTMSCIVLDLLSQYYYDLQSSDGKKFQDFLKDKIKEFDISISPLIASYSYSKKSGWYNENIDTAAKAFWHGYRCGVIHNAMILEYGRISWPPVGNRLVKLRNRDDKLGKEVVVNPRSLLKRVRLVFNAYIRELLNPINIKLRTCFANKFQRDFGITLTP